MKKIMMLILSVLPIALLLLGLRREEGCPAEGKAVGCYGPQGHYWTVWEAQLAFQTPMLIGGIILAVPIIILGVFKKWKAKTIFIAGAAMIAWNSLISVIFYPVTILY